MKQFTPIMLILSLLINVALGALLYLGGFGSVEPEAPEENLAEIRASGVYGPEGIKIVEGDAVISSAGVTLQNTLITGNLILTEEIEDGSLSLKNVIVQGSVVVNGGGEGTIVLEDALCESIVVNQPLRRVRILAKGNTAVEEVLLQTGALLEEGELASEAPGFKAVRVHTEAEVDLIGNFMQVFLEAKAHLLVRWGRLDRLLAAKEARDSYIEFFEEAAVEYVELLAPVELAGVGEVRETLVRGAGLTKLGGTFAEILTGGQGIFIEFTGGMAEILTVEASEGNVSIHIPENVTVAQMILDGKASVTGQGTIELVQINADGTIIAQSPGKVELAKGITALVADKELPEPEPPPAPKPSTPTVLPRVSLSSIKNQSLGAPGTTLRNSRTIEITATPSNAGITVSSSNTGVVTASLSGKSLTITGVKAGSATITVTAKRSGYRDRTITFKVSVIGPTAVQSFEIGDRQIIPGQDVVTVKIYASDPSKYNVFVKGHPLKYLPDYQHFYGSIPEADAKQSNVTVHPK